MGPNFDRYLAKRKRKLAHHGFSLNIVKNGDGGFCDFDSKQIKIATKNQKWEHTFIHEYCHFLQWLDLENGKSLPYDHNLAGSTKFWNTACGYVDWNIAHGYPDRHVSQTQWEAMCEATKEMEMDADRRMFRQIRQNDLEVSDICKLKKQCNAYYAVFDAMKMTGVWYKGKLFSNQKIIELMPSRLTKKLNQDTFSSLCEELYPDYATMTAE